MKTKIIHLTILSLLLGGTLAFAASEKDEAPVVRQDPMMELLAGASTFLDHEQKLALVQLLAQHREERQQQRAERRAERGRARQKMHQARSAHRLETMVAILELSDDQKKSIGAIMEKQQAKIEEIREGFRAEYHDGEGRPTEEVRQSHRALFDEIREDGRKQIREILSEDQQELFDALAELRPDDRPRRGAGDRPGPRRGGHGRRHPGGGRRG